MASDAAMESAKLKLKAKRIKKMEETKSSNTTFDEAFLALQQDLPVIPKTKSGFNFVYAPYETVWANVAPVLKRHGFYIAHESRVDHERGIATVFTSLVLAKTGDRITSEQPYDIKASDQNRGKSLTYGKRYNTVLLLGLSIEGEPDTDDSVPKGARQAQGETTSDF